MQIDNYQFKKFILNHFKIFQNPACLLDIFVLKNYQINCIQSDMGFTDLEDSPRAE